MYQPGAKQSRDVICRRLAGTAEEVEPDSQVGQCRCLQVAEDGLGFIVRPGARYHHMERLAPSLPGKPLDQCVGAGYCRALRRHDNGHAGRGQGER